MLALRTVTYCTENEETPPGRTVRHRPDQDGSDLRRRVACGRRHPGQHLRSRWHRRSGHQRGAARRRATGSRAAVSWHAKSPIGNVGIAPLAESSSPLGGTRSEQEDRRSVHRFIGSSVHRFIGSADQRPQPGQFHQLQVWPIATLEHGKFVPRSPQPPARTMNGTCTRSILLRSG